MQPLISVVMATYQGERFLKIQLDSILAQDYSNIEIICVDDASTDETCRMLRQYADKDARVKIFENGQNIGFIKTFEKGMQEACGEYIAPSDQDDYWVPTKLSQLQRSIGAYSLIYSDSQLIDDLGNFLPKKMSHLKKQIAYDSPLMYTFGAWAPGHSMLFKKDLLIHSFPFSRFVTHDYLLGFVATGQQGIQYIPECLVHYRQHDSNVIGANLNKVSKKRISRLEKDAIICERIKLLVERTAKREEKEIFEALYLHFKGNNFANRWSRFTLVMKHRKKMLAFKGKSQLGEFLYPFKLLFNIY